MQMPQSRWAHRITTCACFILIPLACSPSQGATDKARRHAALGAPSAVYNAQGTVRAIPDARDTVTIAHEDIPGFMKAMTMMFETKDAEQLRGLSVGDKVTFTLGDYGGGRLVVESIKRAP